MKCDHLIDGSFMPRCELKAGHRGRCKATVYGASEATRKEMCVSIVDLFKPADLARMRATIAHQHDVDKAATRDFNRRKHYEDEIFISGPGPYGILPQRGKRKLKKRKARK